MHPYYTCAQNGSNVSFIVFTFTHCKLQVSAIAASSSSIRTRFYTVSYCLQSLQHTGPQKETSTLHHTLNFVYSVACSEQQAHDDNREID